MLLDMLGLLQIKRFTKYEINALESSLSVTVPGAIAGWIELSKKYGNLKIEEILDLGINLCHVGLKSMKNCRSQFYKKNSADSVCLWILQK